MAATPPRYPVLQVMLSNALLLSVIYLVVGIVFEVLLHVYPAKWVETATVVLDSLPARALHVLGLLGPLTEAAAYNRISGFMVRAVFAVTTIGVIFLLAALVALLMTVVAKLADRRRRTG